MSCKPPFGASKGRTRITFVRKLRGSLFRCLAHCNETGIIHCFRTETKRIDGRMTDAADRDRFGLSVRRYSKRFAGAHRRLVALAQPKHDCLLAKFRVRIQDDESIAAFRFGGAMKSR